MRMMLILAVASLFAAPAAQAQQRPNADANGDGVVTRAEADAMADQLFGRMDANRDGRVTESELSSLGRGGGRAEGRGGRMLQMLDGDRDAAVTREEFLTGMARRHARLDSNGDGSLSAAEREAGRAGRGGRYGAGSAE